MRKNVKEFLKFKLNCLRIKYTPKGSHDHVDMINISFEKCVSKIASWLFARSSVNFKSWILKGLSVIYRHGIKKGNEENWNHSIW